MNVKMDKKTLIIAAVVLIVAGGAYYGYNRWRQQRLVNQILQGAYGVDTSLWGKITGGGNVNNQVAQEVAKQMIQGEALQKAEEAREAAKTPEEKFNATKATTVMGEISPIMSGEIEPALKAVFGKMKITAYGTGYLGGQSGSFGATVKVPRVVTAEDLNKLATAFKSKGYTVLSSAAESDSGNVTLMKGESISLTFTYSGGGEDQEVEVLYWNLAASQ
jgi:hypothetical protein